MAKIALLILFCHLIVSFGFAFYWQAKYVFTLMVYVNHYKRQGLSQYEANSRALVFMRSGAFDEEHWKRLMLGWLWALSAFALLFGFFALNQSACWFPTTFNGVPKCVELEDGTVVRAEEVE